MGAATASRPRTRILGQSLIRVKDLDLMGRAIAPVPENKVDIIGSCAGSEARHKYARHSIGDEPFREQPRGHGLAVMGELLPGAPQIGHCDFIQGSFALGTKVDYVLTINFVGTNGKRIELAGESLSHFLEHAFDGQCRVKSCFSLRIEASACLASSVA